MDDEENPLARRFDPFDLVVTATTFAWMSARCVTGLLDAVDDLARGHSNWRRGRRAMALSVHDTIARL